MIKTLLIDADGVLQHGPFGWYEGVQARTGATTHCGRCRPRVARRVRNARLRLWWRALFARG